MDYVLAVLAVGLILLIPVGLMLYPWRCEQHEIRLQWRAVPRPSFTLPAPMLDGYNLNEPYLELYCPACEAESKKPV